MVTIERYAVTDTRWLRKNCGDPSARIYMFRVECGGRGCEVSRRHGMAVQHAARRAASKANRVRARQWSARTYATGADVSTKQEANAWV